MGYGLDLSQHHGLHLTTELKQGISILQMSAVDLSEYVRACAGENPFLDEEYPEPIRPYELDKQTWDTSSDALFDNRGSSSLESFDNELRDMSHRTFSFDRYLVKSDSLEECLVEQLHMQVDDLRARAIGEYLIGCIDGNGYLKVPLGHIADTLGVIEDEVLQVLMLIQHFEPTGVGSRDLAECLKLQLDAAGKMTPLLQTLIDHHITDFVSRTPTAIAHDMGISLATLSEALDIIRTCNPRPAGQFGNSSRPIWPEVIVRSLGDGVYGVELQDLYLPHLHISKHYRLLASSACDKDSQTQTYLKEKLKEAESLVESINYRSTTLYKIACCIAENQVDFFDKGYDHLRPLTMSDVSEATTLSISTVSRMVNGNYMQTPRGVFELRFFFHSSAKCSSGQAISSRSVKRRISELVSHEDPAHPLSDRALAEAFSAQGVSVSRRTVNKYRDELGIPSRAARRRC